MIYRIVSDDRITERMKGSLIIPPTVLEQVKLIAGFQPQDDGLGKNSLETQQTYQVANILGFRPEPERFNYSVDEIRSAGGQRLPGTNGRRKCR